MLAIADRLMYISILIALQFTSSALRWTNAIVEQKECLFSVSWKRIQPLTRLQLNIPDKCKNGVLHWNYPVSNLTLMAKQTSGNPFRLCIFRYDEEQGTRVRAISPTKSVMEMEFDETELKCAKSIGPWVSLLFESAERPTVSHLYIRYMILNYEPNAKSTKD
ncbi:hypothetical protein ACOME3_009540 [Neoechinorhynchus agilis]